MIQMYTHSHKRTQTLIDEHLVARLHHLHFIPLVSIVWSFVFSGFFSFVFFFQKFVCECVFWFRYWKFMQKCAFLLAFRCVGMVDMIVITDWKCVSKAAAVALCQVRRDSKQTKHRLTLSHARNFNSKWFIFGVHTILCHFLSFLLSFVSLFFFLLLSWRCSVFFLPIFVYRMVFFVFAHLVTL